LDVVTCGRPEETRPVLFVGNHVSYIDITVLGSVLEASFVAKSEVARWPLFGILAKLQRTVFVERQSLRAVDQRDAIAQRLEAGDGLILFPEGTSSDGIRVLPFKSALFGVAERQSGSGPLVVQPFSLAYTHINGLPMGRDWQPLIAWYGDMALMPHMLRFLSLGIVRAEVRFHEPVTIGGFESRKDLADHCYRQVALGAVTARSGVARAAINGDGSAPFRVA
jgi:1-acyl-sn-glycerol-3-phosphate acyltransferase